MRSKTPYPPCTMNPTTEKPFKAHKWVINESAPIKAKQIGSEPIYYYRVRCARCGLNDPVPPLH